LKARGNNLKKLIKGKKMEYSTILLEKVEEIMVLKLNLPDALNPMTQ
jgi:hypothetical protein